MIRSYLPIVIFMGIALAFLAGSFLASTLLGPKRRTMAKTAPYECGIVPENDTQRRFGVKFYLLAIAFIVLDVEIIFLYPFSTVFVRRTVGDVDIAGLGSAGIAVMGIFLLILLVPFAYLLSSGALNFGPMSEKSPSVYTPITRSQGFVAAATNSSSRSTASRVARDDKSVAGGSSEASAASEETTGSERPEGREALTNKSSGTDDSTETRSSEEEGEK